MSQKTKQIAGNMLIAQSGGPTVVINQSLVGAVMEAKKHKEIKKIYGALHGIKGILGEDLIDLGRENVHTLQAVANTPSSGLGSVRKKPTPEDCAKIFEKLKKHGVRYFFYIGGNDSAETTHIINEEAKKAGYQLRCFHIPKTVDNDLRENDHTPGWASAAKFVAQAFMGDDLDNAALPGVKINIVMGRHAGFLTAAAALARTYPGAGPHLIYLPERPFDVTRFAAEVKKAYQKHGRCVVAVSEGIVDADGTPIAAAYTKEVDSHGNVQLSGTGALGDFLVGLIKQKTDISRVRADTFGYLQRSFPGVVSENDAKEAFAAGREAVRLATSGDIDGSVAIRRKKGKKYQVHFERVELRSVAKETRHMPDAYIAKNGCDVTKAFLDYAAPIVGQLPKIGRFKKIKVKK
ncbi:MAG: 6-phosphofructokinase [Kiritimatiellae bacterium]|jgi:6-phosphofructokinase 1|nr:6-phosphofructokinase [Kiritimatiellia bacterium]MDD4117803.1 6-phosphofructokinase [Kiritimatiellia bacterium]NCC94082.1 6-phosphofructokinase [Opitutae bacterium]